MALKPAGRTLSSLTGIVVMAAVAWLLLNFVWAPSCGRFACSYVPSWWPQAHADSTAQGCPDSIGTAATDAGGAAERYESIRDAKITTGLLFDPDGTEHTVTSGGEDVADRVDELLRASGKVDMPPVGQHPAATHVEVKAAMMMRDAEIPTGVVVINNVEGPCPGAYSCTKVLPVVLVPGSTLTVWWPGMHKQTSPEEGDVIARVPRVLSAISGGAPQSWHYAYTREERHRLIGKLLGEDRGHVLFYAWDHPAGGDADRYPRHQLKIVYSGEVGAAHFSNGDPENGPVGAWLLQTNQPPTDPPTVIYDPWDPDRIVLPTTALVPVAFLHQIAEGYAMTGQLPNVGVGGLTAVVDRSADWAPVEWV